MLHLREFEISTLGVTSAIERWKANHHAVRAVWKVEDLISEVCDVAAEAIRILKQIPEQGSSIPKTHLLELVGAVLHAVRDAENLGSAAAEHYKVERLSELRSCFSELSTLFEAESRIMAVEGRLPSLEQLATIAIEPPKEWLHEPDCLPK
ncbi:MAG TPA: hypothetical protein VGJ26_21335 [Pirellulales bacterium]|jgi:hypothetical protein